MIILDWNISYMNKISNKIDYLRNKINNDSFILILQEVTPTDYDELIDSFADVATIEYSLSYRKPGKFDTKSRKLGIAIITSKDMKVKKAQVLERAIFPDRTLMVDLEIEDKIIRVLGLHSITGCQHGKAKEIQYYSFAEAIDTYKPDIIGIDANEPEYDHYELQKMIFYNNHNKGEGCKTFFETIYKNNLSDAFVCKYDKTNFIDGEHLACSHIINRGKKKVRYDFLFIRNNLYENFDCTYDFKGATQSGSDHAAIIFNTTLTSKE